MKKYLATLGGILCFGLASWLVYLFFEGDSCADAGGSFNSLIAQCFIAPGESYTPMYRKGTGIFWLIYGFTSLVVGLIITAIFGGLAFALRSFWFHVLRSSRQQNS